MDREHCGAAHDTAQQLRRARIRRATGLTLALLHLFALVTATAKAVEVVVDSPSLGQFVDDAALTVTGHVVGDASEVASLTVNGQSVLPIAGDGTWSLEISLDSTSLFHSIQTDLTATDGTTQRQLSTVIFGDSIAEGQRAENGSALRLNDSGLEALSETIAADLDIDIATLLPPGTLLVENYCYATLIWCLGTIDAVVSDSPPPSFADMGVALDSRTDLAHSDIALNDVVLAISVYDTSGLLSITCTLNVTASLSRIGADFTLQPLASDPKEVDVTQDGGVEPEFIGLENNAGCSGFLGFLVESFVEDAAETMVEEELTTLLDTVDADGNTPIAAAFEVALSGLELADTIGSGFALEVDAIFNDAVLDEAGTTLDLDIAFSPITPDPAAVDLSASLKLPSTLPLYAATTPAGAPYDVALGVDATAFNSLLKAETEKGLLITSITEITLLGTVFPINAALLSLLEPAFGALPPTTPLRFDLAPQLAPVVTNNLGPNNEIAELQLSHLLLSVRANDGSEEEHLSFVVDFIIGLDAGLNETGELSFELGELDPAQLGVRIIDNPLGVDESNFSSVIESALPSLFPELAASLGAFPLPELGELSFSLVEAAKNGDFLNLFLSVPKDEARHAVLFDGTGVVVYGESSEDFSDGHYVQTVPTSFEVGAGAEDNQLGFSGNRRAVLNDGANISVHDFSPLIGFTQTAVTQAFGDLPAGFQNGTDGEDNLLDFPISNLAVLFDGGGVTLHNWDGTTFSGSRSIQGVPEGFESGAAGNDNNLMFLSPELAILWDGSEVKQYSFSPNTGLSLTGTVSGTPAFFETGSGAQENLLGYTLAPASDPSAAETCTAVLYDGVVVRVYDFSNADGFTNMRYVQGTPEAFEWDGAQNQDNHLAFYSPTGAAYINSQNIALYDFNAINGFTYKNDTGQNTTCGACPTISEIGEDGADNQFDFADSETAVYFDGQNVILYDWESELLTNPQTIQGVPTGFETGTDARDNHLAFANANQAVYFNGANVILYDFDTTNGFTNPQSIQGVPTGFETDADAAENVLSILPGCTQPPPPLCTGDEASGDSDGDGVCDDIDPCPADANDDSDGDGSCDSADVCTGDDTSGDPDGDGVCSDQDPCPADANDDSDGDGSCDSDDLCTGNDATLDFDGDGVCSDQDPCPLDALDDSDGDGSCDTLDLCTGDDSSGDPDGDGVCSDQDAFPNDPSETQDSDSDGIGDNQEAADGTDPNDPDSDDDGATDLEEKIAGSDPLDPDSLPEGPAVPALGPLGTGLLGLTLLALGVSAFLGRPMNRQHRTGSASRRKGGAHD